MTRGPTPTFAALPIGGWALHPPIEKEVADAAFGQPLPLCVWSKITRGFERLGMIRDSLSAPRNNNDKSDPMSYCAGRAKAATEIERAFSIVAKQMNRSELNFALQDNADRSRGFFDEKPIRDRLRTAADELMSVMLTIRDAEPQSIAVPSDAQARRALARAIFAALNGAGLADRGSGWAEAEGMSEADLTPTERLLSALEVIQQATPRSTANAIRKALGENPGDADRWFRP